MQNENSVTDFNIYRLNRNVPLHSAEQMGKEVEEVLTVLIGTSLCIVQNEVVTHATPEVVS